MQRLIYVEHLVKTIQRRSLNLVRTIPVHLMRTSVAKYEFSAAGIYVEHLVKPLSNCPVKECSHKYGRRIPVNGNLVGGIASDIIDITFHRSSTGRNDVSDQAGTAGLWCDDF